MVLGSDDRAGKISEELSNSPNFSFLDFQREPNVTSRVKRVNVTLSDNVFLRLDALITQGKAFADIVTTNLTVGGTCGFQTMIASPQHMNGTSLSMTPSSMYQ